MLNLKAMLPGKTLNAAKAGQLIASGNWAVQRKFDGRRIVIASNAHTQDPLILNRDGQQSNLANKIFDTMPLTWLTSQDKTIILDGEWLGDQYVIFDLIHMDDVVSIGNTFEQRWQALAAWWHFWKGMAGTAHYSTPYTVFPDDTQEQIDFIGDAIKDGAEGVIFRNIHSKYHFKRSTDLRRLKFRKRFDAVVSHMNFHDTGVHSVQLSLMDVNGSLIHVCDASTLHFGEIELGHVVEVEFSHLSATGKPQQPVIKSIRDDKAPAACTTEQLKWIPTINNQEGFEEFNKYAKYTLTKMDF